MKSLYQKIKGLFTMKKGNPYSDDETLKNFKGSKEESEETVDDGKPYKKRNDVVNLSSENSSISKKNEQLRKQIEAKRKAIQEGKQARVELPEGVDAEDSLDDNVKQLDTISIDQVMPDKIESRDLVNSESTVDVLSNEEIDQRFGKFKKYDTKMSQLLKEKEGDDYKNKSFKFELTLELPPKRALNALEDYFDIDVSDEMGKMMYNAIIDQINDETLLDNLSELAREYMHGNRKS